jgi:hypothetical protein
MERNQPNMQKKAIIGTLILAFILAGIFLAFQSSGSNGKGSSTKESMDASCQKKDKDGKMIWENLSQQFFSSM